MLLADGLQRSEGLLGLLFYITSFLYFYLFNQCWWFFFDDDKAEGTDSKSMTHWMTSLDSDDRHGEPKVCCKHK